MTDRLLGWCRANRIYLILDLHAAPGGQGKDGNISDYDPEKPSLWESEENRRKTVALWRKLAERYAREPWIGGYDILNEPNWTFEEKTRTVGRTSPTSRSGNCTKRLREAARRGLFELVENLKADRCRYNADVAQALIPAGEAAVAPRTGRN